MQTKTATLRHRLLGVLTATALGGAAAVVSMVPPADAAQDPCAASSVAKTIGAVAEKIGEYLEAHPETDQVMTNALQNGSGAASAATLKAYFQANPKVAGEVEALTQPLQALGTQCRLSIGLPQVMGLQAAQNPGTSGSPGSNTQTAVGGAPTTQAGPLPGPAPTSR